MIAVQAGSVMGTSGLGRAPGAVSEGGETGRGQKRSQRARRADRFPVELHPALSVQDRGITGTVAADPFFVDRAYLDVL